MAAEAKTLGFSQLADRLRMLRSWEEVEKISYRATFGAAKDVKNAAVVTAFGMVQSRTGALVRNIAQKRIRIDAKVGYTIGVRSGTPKQIKSGDDPYYWWWVHFGTAHSDPKPFLTTAWNMLKGRSPEVIIRMGKAAVAGSADRALRKYPNPAGTPRAF